MKSRLIPFLTFFCLVASQAFAGDIDMAKLKAQIKAELKDEIKAEIRNEVKAELRKELEPQVRKELAGEIKKDSKSQPTVAKTETTEKSLVWDKLKFSGQVRVRPEIRRNLSQTVPMVPGEREEDVSTLLRSRFGIRYNPEKHVSFFVQGQDSREFGEEASASAAAVGDDEGVDLHQGYIDFLNIDDSDVSVRLGRQELSLGDERLVGAVDWSNVGRALDGIVITLDKPGYAMNTWAFATDRTTISNSGDGQYAAGVYGTWKEFPKGVLDGYYILLQDNDGATGVASGTGDTLSVHTIGFRAKSNFDNGIDFGAESAVQLGKFGSNSILAFAGHGKAGYTFDAEVKPRVGVEYNYATGDDNTSDRYTKFNSLFATEHFKYGYMDLEGWSNMHDASLAVSAKPGKFFVEGSYHLLGVDKNHSADTFGGFTGGPGVGKIAGHEIDLLSKWTINDYANLLGGYSHFIPGAFFKDQGMDTSADFFYLQAMAEFK
ncbi:MAG TPA: hypothetical protein DDW49_04420 [Deltaproteobacteria bacterium]|nr:MAG: hypothetical protein A2048_06585 [Deltaproteobacteria bacterium GWA2_45_12]HBF12625.1 hypothetical protein [Deltaproteobacteria bacterium]